jgi:hypothetical protein
MSEDSLNFNFFFPSSFPFRFPPSGVVGFLFFFFFPHTPSDLCQKLFLLVEMGKLSQVCQNGETVVRFLPYSTLCACDASFTPPYAVLGHWFAYFSGWVPFLFFFSAS